MAEAVVDISGILDLDPLVAEIRRRYDAMRIARRSLGIDNRLYDCYYRRLGKYTPSKEKELRAELHGADPVFVQLTPVKARTVAAYLRDLYTAQTRPWSLEPTPVPELPENAEEPIAELVAAEVKAAQANGEAVSIDEITERVRALTRQVEEAAIAKARDEARATERRVNDLLVEGEFYEALIDFIEDFTTYPYAILKGPVVRNKPKLRWQVEADGTFSAAVDTTNVQMTWERVDPHNFWWTPGATSIATADTCEILRYTPARFESFRNVAGFDTAALDRVLSRYGETGFRFHAPESTDPDNLDSEKSTDTGQPIIEVLEFTGRVLGSVLQTYAESIADFAPTKSYFVRAWVVGDELLKLDVEDNPILRPPYYVAQFVTLPGSLVGIALPELLADMQDALNGVMRALTFNIALASGPQVEVDVGRIIDPNDTAIRPWKIWLVDYNRSPNMGNSPVVRFNDVPIRAGELMPLISLFNQLAEDHSAIPRYLTGEGRTGGAGRTATGLAMLTDNANRIMQTIAQTIDLKVLRPALELLYTLLVYTAPDEFRGDLKVIVKGASYARQREVSRNRLLEILNVTSNPVDLQLIGIEGRAALLKRLLADLQLEGEAVDPVTKIRAMQAADRMTPGPAPATERGGGQTEGTGRTDTAAQPSTAGPQVGGTGT